MRGWPLIKILPQKTNFHFVKYARPAGILSVLLCVASIVACFYPGLNMGIDFRGGASMEVSKPAGQEIQLDRVREAVSGLNLGDVQVQGIARRDTNANDGSTAILRFQVPEGRDQTQVVRQVEGAVSQAVQDQAQHRHPAEQQAVGQKHEDHDDGEADGGRQGARGDGVGA